MRARPAIVAMLAASVVALAACQAPDPAPADASSTTPSIPESPAPSSTAPSPSPSAPPSATPDPGPVAAPPPTTCDDIGTAAGRATWQAQGFAMEPFDGPLVGGPVGYTDALAPHLSVHCALWSAERAFGAYLLVEWYVGIDADAFLAQPFLATYGRTDIPTNLATMTVVGTDVDSLVGSAEYLIADGDTLLRVVSNGFDVTGAGPTGFDTMQLVVQGVWHEAE